MSTATEKKTKTRSVEEVELELSKAHKAHRDLTQERAEISSRLKASAAEDQEALTEAALSGTLKGAKTPRLDRARSRATELPYLTWASELRVLALQEEYAVAKRAELDPQIRELGEAVEKAEAAFEEARTALNAARNEHASMLEEKRDLDRGRHQRQGRLAQLREEGPRV